MSACILRLNRAFSGRHGDCFNYCSCHCATIVRHSTFGHSKSIIFCLDRRALIELELLFRFFSLNSYTQIAKISCHKNMTRLGREIKNNLSYFLTKTYGCCYSIEASRFFLSTKNIVFKQMDKKIMKLLC